MSETEDEEPTPPSFQGQIAHIAGRRAKGGERGWSAITEFAMSMPDGTVKEFESSPGSERASLQHLAIIAPGVFGADAPVCPICLDAATAREHVPQTALGGSVMTLTCAPCNNGLGSRVEVALEHWFDNTIGRVSFQHAGGIPGRRKVPNIRLLREVDGDEGVLFVDGSFPDEVVEMLQSGTASITYSPPDPRRWRLALLKHAYLAACLYLKSVPDTEEIRAIRADLIAARDGDMRGRPPESEAAMRLRVYRSEAGRQGSPLALVAKVGEGDEPPEGLISLAGVLFVSWPFESMPLGFRRVAVDD